MNYIEAFNNAAYIQLSGMVAAMLFFAMAAYRELNDKNFQGLIYLVLGGVFLIFHILLLLDLSENALSSCGLDFWQWLIKFLAPALVFLLIAFGVFSLLRLQIQAALIKVSLGLLLLLLMAAVESNGANDIQGVIILLSCGFWFQLELKTAG